MEKKYLSRKDIVGKQVIDSKGMIVGTVKDLSFDIEARDIGLTITTKEKKEVNLSSSDLSSVGDVVLLKKAFIQAEALKTVEKAPPPPPPQKPAKAGLCPACGYQNELTSKFCIKCGAKLG